ncbi:hypothetical protein CBL_04229 [Carabus blaptoides fortunei]
MAVAGQHGAVPFYNTNEARKGLWGRPLASSVVTAATATSPPLESDHGRLFLDDKYNTTKPGSQGTHTRTKSDHLSKSLRGLEAVPQPATTMHQYGSMLPAQR